MSEVELLLANEADNCFQIKYSFWGMEESRTLKPIMRMIR